MSMREKAEAQVEAIREKIEASVAAAILGIGLGVSISHVLLGAYIFGYENIIMASVLLFGIVEIPRMRRVPQAVRLISTTMLAGVAVLLIHNIAPGLIQSSAPLAILLLFVSTMLIAFFEQREGTLSVSARVADHAPYMGILSGIGLFGVFAL
jgi:hypothetical protein